MRIGILTFHRAPNIGGILQAYALQRTLAELGHDSEMIDYRRGSVEPIYLRPWTVVDDLYIEFVDGLSDFIDKQCKLSNPYFRSEDLIFDDEYDWILVGSDQVWNPQLIAKDASWLLEFQTGGSRLASYAASFGMPEIPAQLHDRYSKMFSKLKHISIRESNAGDIVNQFTRDFETVLDPTFLLSSEQWNAITEPEDGVLPDSPYILVYLLVYDEHAMNIAERLHRDTGYPIVILTGPTVLRYLRDSGDSDHCLLANPHLFIRAIKQASLVITHSYHAVLFSINYQKPFYVTSIDHVISNWGPVDGRLTDILSQFDISERFLVNGSELPDTKIDYREAANLLENKRIHSLSFLKRFR